MKKSIFYYLFAVVCTVCLFTACSDDDDDNKATLTVDQVVGNFTGSFEVLGTPVPGSVRVTKVSDSKITLGLDNLNIAGMNIDPISVECNVALDKDRDEFNITGAGSATISALGATFPVTVSGDVDARELDVDIIVAEVPTLGSIKVEFEGRK